MRKFFLLTLSLLISSPVFAQFEHCGNDYNCYYETKEKIEEEEEQEEDREEEFYRRQHLELEQEQVEEVERQSDLIEEQVDEQYESEPAPEETGETSSPYPY